MWIESTPTPSMKTQVQVEFFLPLLSYRRNRQYKRGAVLLLKIIIQKKCSKPCNNLKRTIPTNSLNNFQCEKIPCLVFLPFIKNFIFKQPLLKKLSLIVGQPLDPLKPYKAKKYNYNLSICGFQFLNGTLRPFSFIPPYIYSYIYIIRTYI